LASARRQLADLKGREIGVDEDPAARLRARIGRRLASENAAAAGRLRAGADALQVTALAKLLGRDFAGAWQAYLAVKAASGAADQTAEGRAGPR
jgi:hypothetical protein